MAENRGKQFEGVIKEAFEKVQGVSIDRLHDQTNGFVGSSNICDFIVYKEPNEIYIECKSCHGNTFPLSNITDNQRKGMLEKSNIYGVLAGVIIWWVDKDLTVFVPIKEIQRLKDADNKSISANAVLDGYIWCYEIPGKKKRVFFDYDMQKFLEDVQSGKD